MHMNGIQAPLAHPRDLHVRNSYERNSGAFSSFSRFSISE